jgi:hypothetical protein
VQESEKNNIFKRKTDYKEDGTLPGIQDTWILAEHAHRRIDDLKIDHELVKRAFIKDDLGTPDYDGHRKSHKTINDTQALVQDYKVSMTKDVIKIVVGFLIGALAIGVASYFKT